MSQTTSYGVIKWALELRTSHRFKQMWSDSLSVTVDDVKNAKFY